MKWSNGTVEGLEIGDEVEGIGFMGRGVVKRIMLARYSVPGIDQDDTIVYVQVGGRHDDQYSYWGNSFFDSWRLVGQPQPNIWENDLILEEP